MRRAGYDVPALQCVHELAGRIEAFPHDRRLLAHSNQSILQQACLVLRRRGRRRHVDVGGSNQWGKWQAVVFNSIAWARLVSEDLVTATESPRDVVREEMSSTAQRNQWDGGDVAELVGDVGGQDGASWLAGYKVQPAAASLLAWAVQGEGGIIGGGCLPSRG